MEKKTFYQVVRIAYEAKEPTRIADQYYSGYDQFEDEIGVFETLEEAKKFFDRNIDIDCRKMRTAITYYYSEGGAINVYESEPDEDGEYSLDNAEYVGCEEFVLPDYVEETDEDEEEEEE